MNSNQFARQALLRLSLLSNLFISPKPPFSSGIPCQFSSATVRKLARKAVKESSSSKPTTRDSAILDKFKLRQIKGTFKQNSHAKSLPHKDPPPTYAHETGNGKETKGEDGKENMVFWGFEALGLDKKELREAMKMMGIFVPSEIQCVGIPAILDGKNLVLSSPAGSGRTLAYLLPLLQLLRRDKMVDGMKSNHLQAVVICATEELADQVFQLAKFINDHVKVKAKLEDDVEELASQDHSSSSQLGMLVATPSEILQHMEEGLMVVDNVKFLVMDDADLILSCGLGPEVCKILTSFKACLSKSKDRALQTVLVTSEMAKILGQQYVEHFERDHAGEVTAMFLEMDQEEVFELMKSLEALKKKMQEAMDSLLSDSSVSSSSDC